MKIADTAGQIEYMVLSMDDAHKTALLSLRQSEILEELQSATLDPKLELKKPAGWYVSVFASSRWRQG